MQRRYFLFKVLVALAAVAVQLRVSLPSYSIKLGMNGRSFTIALTRANTSREHKQDQVALASPAANQGSGGTLLGDGTGTVSAPRRDAPAAAAASPESQSAAASQASSPTGGDTARVEFMKIAREGTSVLAGSAAPGAQVTVFENDTPVGTATAGADGNWSLATEHRFASIDPSASLHAAIGPPPPQAAKHGESPGLPGVAAQSPTTSSSTTASSANANPAAQLIKEFANTVEAARKEAEQKSAEEVGQTSGQVTAGRSTDGRSTGAQASIAAETQPSMSASQAPESREQNVARAETTARPSELAANAPPEPASIPIPMQFVYRETTLTDEGRQAVALLLDYLKLKKFDAVTLSGHADERGSDDYNLELSRGRLEAVVEILRKGGYEGAVKMEPKGKSEPFKQVDRQRFGYEDLMQLDRRVELRVAR